MGAQTLLSTAQVCRLAGCTFRQADYWARSLVEPARQACGSGSQRGWTLDQAAELRVLNVLSRIGATAPVNARVLTQLRTNPDRWRRRMVVDVDGDLWPLSAGRDGWLVDFATCRAHVGIIADASQLATA